MFSSEQLYYQAPYSRELRATIIAIREEKGSTAVILDKTIFYPEGGGQPGDRGFLDGVKVVDTQQNKATEILHLLEQRGTFSVGQEVSLKLDWAHRYDFMQQHSGQHLLSGTLFNLFKIGTVAVHLGHTDLSIELDVDNLSFEQIKAVEDTVNRAIRENVPIVERTVKQAEIPSLGLRRSVKVDTDVRIITLEGYDEIACGGLHVKESSEIEYIYYLRSERIRGHLRTFWVAGRRAIEGIRRNTIIVDSVGTLLSVPPDGIVESVSALQAELAQSNWERNVHATEVARLLLEKAYESAQKVQGVPIILLEASAWRQDYFRQLPEAFTKLDALALAVVRERQDGKLSWLICLKGMGDEGKLFNTIRQEALVLIGGKGGGRPPMWQGIGENSGSKEEFLKKVEALFREYLSEKGT
ncbi:MAG: alanine--tRNA ligase-related protein [Sphaerochaetaceae bacterium]